MESYRCCPLHHFWNCQKLPNIPKSESLEGVILSGLGLPKIGDADEGAWQGLGLSGWHNLFINSCLLSVLQTNVHCKISLHINTYPLVNALRSPRMEIWIYCASFLQDLASLWPILRSSNAIEDQVIVLSCKGLAGKQEIWNFALSLGKLSPFGAKSARTVGEKGLSFRRH